MDEYERVEAKYAEKGWDALTPREKSMLLIGPAPVGSY